MLQKKIFLISTLTIFLTMFLTFSTFSVQAGSLHIMLTNDDGIEAPGIKAVEKALISAGHRVSVVAPATQQSGASSSITGGEIQLSEQGKNRWAVHAKPVDAARIGLGYLLANDLPDLVISGANFGQNIGADTMVSGTVGAALEAQRAGIASIAISTAVDLEEAGTSPRFKSTLAVMDDAATFLADFISNPEVLELAGKSLININYPVRNKKDLKGIRITQLSQQSLTGRRYKTAEGQKVVAQYNHIDPQKADNDAELLERGYITISFLKSDLAVTDKDNKRYSKSLNKILKMNP